MDTISERFPKTVEKVVEILIKDLSFKEKSKIANLSETALINFHSNYGIYLRSRFRISGNDPLMASCKSISGISELSPEQASFVILKTLQNTLKHSNVLKIIK